MIERLHLCLLWRSHSTRARQLWLHMSTRNNKDGVSKARQSVVAAVAIGSERRDHGSAPCGFLFRLSRRFRASRL